MPSATPTATQAFADLIARREVVVCVGSGGVGKTTTSAVIALHAAIQGRKVLVLTIDPARRLANSLGVEALGNEIQQIPLEKFRSVGLEPKGELWAMMLDMKQSFDDLVARHSPDEKSRDDILNNRFYQYFSTSLAGTQEYAASERLHDLYTAGDFDLIVLDTPPTTHALDFLEAPNRLADAVSSKALQWLYKPGIFSGRTGLGLFSVGTSYVMKTLSRFTGGELLNDLGVFLRSFSTLFEGFEQRARRVQALLTDEVTTFVVVTAPDSITVDEALYFYDQLGFGRLHVGGFVANRVHPMWVAAPEQTPGPEELAGQLDALGAVLEEPLPSPSASMAARLLENAEQFRLRAAQDTQSLERLAQVLPARTPVVTVPFFAQDIHSLEGLNQARRALFEGPSGPGVRG